MRLEKQEDGWWVEDFPPYVVDGETFTDIGPYRTKEEAEHDKRSMTKFFQQERQPKHKK